MIAEGGMVPTALRGNESPVGVKPGIVEHQVECAVAQRPTRRREIELGDGIRHFLYRLSLFGIKAERVTAKLEWSCLELLINIFLREEEQILRHGQVVRCA